MPALNTTTQWIDTQVYKNSTNQFAVPALLTDYQLKIEYVKRAVRQFHVDYIEMWLDRVFTFLRWTYFVNLNPTDFSTVILNEKGDRQIVFCMFIIIWLLDKLYEKAFSNATPDKWTSPKVVSSS